MNRYTRISLLSFVALVVASGLAFAQAQTDNPATLQVGAVSPKLVGGEFYVGTGTVDLYNDSLFGGLKPSGQSVQVTVAIQANKDTGEVLKISTLRSKDLVTVVAQGGTVWEDILGGGPYIQSNLHGRIAVSDVQSSPTWQDAINAVNGAIQKGGTYTAFMASAKDGSVVAVKVNADVYSRGPNNFVEDMTRGSSRS